MEQIKSISEKVIDAFSSGRCPVCAMLRQDEFDGLCHWVGQSAEQYRGSDERKKLLDCGGFCNYHFWELQGINTNYGSAGFGLELIERLIQVLRNHDYEHLIDAFKERNEDFKVWSLEGNVHCPLCRDLKKKEKNYLRELMVILQDNVHKTKYADGYGLCIPHFVKTMDYIEDDSLIRFLFETEIAQLEKVKIDAANFIQKKEPPLCWQQTEDEKKSWFRAIEKIVGRSGT